MTAPLIKRTYRDLLEKNDLPLGSSVENAVTWRLFRAGLFDRFQHNVGPYRLDYAWPDLKVGEAWLAGRPSDFAVGFASMATRWPPDCSAHPNKETP